MEEKKTLGVGFSIPTKYIKEERYDVLARLIHRMFTDLSEYDIPHNSFKDVVHYTVKKNSGRTDFCINIQFENEKEFVRYEEKE